MCQPKAHFSKKNVIKYMILGNHWGYETNIIIIAIGKNNAVFAKVSINFKLY